MNEHEDIPEARGGIPMSSGSLSVYRHGGDALDDFPVLKAFQQYVDAEQAKAHKRLMTVCVFFTMLILAVTGVFLFIIFEMNRKASGEDPTLKALSDSNAALQKQILDQTIKMNERFMTQMSSDRERPSVDVELQRRNLELQSKLNALEIENRLRAERAAEDEKRRREEAARPKPAPAPGMTKEEQAAKLRQFKQAAAAIHEREEELRKKEESLKAREAKTAAEAERLKQKEKQLHRQSLYPEYFDEDGNELPQPVRRRPPAQPTPRPAATQAEPVAQPTPRPAAAKPEPAAAPAPKATPAPAAKERDDIDELDDILPPIDSDGNETKVDGKGEGEGKGKPAAAPKTAPAPKPAAVPKPAATSKPQATPKPAPRAKPAVSPNDIIAPQKKPQAATGEAMQLDVNGANSAWTIPLE